MTNSPAALDSSPKHNQAGAQVLHPLPSPNAAPHLVDARPLDLVIPRLRGRLVDDVGRRLAQLGPLALEAHVAHARDVLVAVAKVVDEEEAQPLHLAEEGALDGDLLHGRRLRQLQLLHGLEVLGRREVEVVAVDVQVQRLGRRGGGGCA